MFSQRNGQLRGRLVKSVWVTAGGQKGRSTDRKPGLVCGRAGNINVEHRRNRVVVVAIERPAGCQERRIKITDVGAQRRSRVSALEIPDFASSW